MEFKILSKEKMCVSVCKNEWRKQLSNVCKFALISCDNYSDDDASLSLNVQCMIIMIQ